MLVHFALTVLVPIYSAYALFKVSKELSRKLKEKNIISKNYSILVLILGLVGLNVVSYVLLEKQSNLLLGE
jgi:hypothetical protein